MRRKQNVIVFSAGESVNNGKVAYLQKELEKQGIHCVDWGSLFRYANNTDQIALLPSLTKKIPTFDFALVLAEGVDKARLRGNDIHTVMRDNVIFELGLCIMGLGAERVILLAEENVRIPEDLTGVTEMGVAHITFHEKRMEDSIDELSNLVHQKADSLDELLTNQLDEIIDHIQTKADLISPVFVGAAVASAEAYFLNFIVRLLDHLEEKSSVKLVEDGSVQTFDDFQLKIILPNSTQRLSYPAIRNYYAQNGYKEYVIENASIRSLTFFGKTEENNIFSIVDIPTSITASYVVVNSVLDMDADDEFDLLAEERFVAKEMDLYLYALRKLLTPEVAKKRLSFFNKKKKEIISAMVSKVMIINEDIKA